MLLDLVLCNAHLQEILQHSLDSGVVQINTCCIGATGCCRLSRRRRWCVRIVNFQTPRRNDALSRRLRCGATPVATTQQRAQAKAAVVLSTASTGSTNWSVLLLTAERGLRRPTRERLALGIFVRILLPLIDLLLELLCLFLIRKAETR
jgi:hypothetical protein